MGNVHENITDELKTFIEKQHMFFVASAPLDANGHVNVSPKGLDSFRVLSKTQVAYLDMTGSGNETSAHIAENGRITFMFCAFEGSPNIVRLHGTGRTILPDMPEWAELSGKFPAYSGMRQIILADIHRVSDACGFAVPLYDYQGQRPTLTKYWDVKGDEAVTEYHQKKNRSSIDGMQTPLSKSIETD